MSSRLPIAALTAALVLWSGCAGAAASGSAEPAGDLAQMRGWVEEMKAAPRGPFARVVWFCKDGTVLPPTPYACRDHGGGVQHGEWTDRAKQLRERGYLVANVLASLDVETAIESDDFLERFSQIVVEQFLISIDDGWVLRKARYYRGAMQEESERRAARRLLYKLAEDREWITHRFLALRTGARMLSHGAETSSVAEVRQLSADLSERDPGFQSVRNKIHVRPERDDAASVRAYAKKVKDPALAAELERLAVLIEEVHSPRGAIDALRKLAGRAAKVERLAAIVSESADRLEAAKTPAARFVRSAAAMATLRDAILIPNGPSLRVAIVDASLALESEHYVAASALARESATASRRDRLGWLDASVRAMYGAGLVSSRQADALEGALGRLRSEPVGLTTWKRELDYLALVPAWSTQWLRYHFGAGERRLAEIEPKTELFFQDLLRGSALFFYAEALDHLLRDANRMAGVRRDLFGENVGGGLRSLNPGLARGVLRTAPADARAFEADGIYLLPETVSDLPPVAGILTRGEGNPLSHVQLLARNLGIPNVGVDESLVARIETNVGKPIELAVSPFGSVRLALSENLPAAQAEAAPDVLIRPDLDKLDVSVSDLLTLSTLRASDSGRTVGPKAAKLGELHHHYPEAVADGLAIPFGVFRALLERPHPDGGGTVFEWMVSRYRALEAMPAGSPERTAATEKFRDALYRWVENVDPGDAFRERLREAMARVFGADGSYGVFVRSDTNVEDLPGFTGAGLNLTVVNVVGVDAVLAAIPRVWASPFTARAFAWRQAHMDTPEHVYPAVLLLRSVPAEKSGVLVTQDVDTGDRGKLSVAVNEGVGGAVDGQAAESLRIDVDGGAVRLMAQATATFRRAIDPAGGVKKLPVSNSERVLEDAEIAALIEFSRALPGRFPAIVDADGRVAPADIEFGFLDGRLNLFQIRPFLESKRARSNSVLTALDADIQVDDGVVVRLDEPPMEETP